MSEPTYDEIKAAADKIGMTVNTFRHRLRRGMSFEEAKNTPKLTKSQCGTNGASASHWRRNFKLRGSLDYDERIAAAKRKAGNR